MVELLQEKHYSVMRLFLENFTGVSFYDLNVMQSSLKFKMKIFHIKFDQKNFFNEEIRHKLTLSFAPKNFSSNHDSVISLSRHLVEKREFFPVCVER